MKWPEHKIRKTKHTDRRKLAEWLAEWDMDRQLADPDATQSAPAGEEPMQKEVCAPAVCPGLYDQDAIGAGEVRLFASSSGAASDWPLYVAVLAAPAEDGFCCVPFSRYSVPALPEEWSTGIRHAALRVLCFWNVQHVKMGGMPPGWRVKRLSYRQLKPIHEVRNLFDMGAPLPAALRKRVGPLLMHPADPRHEYMAEERKRVTSCFRPGADRCLTQNEEDGLYISEWTRNPEEWLLAAEGREKYGVAAAVYHTEDHTVIVAVYEKEADQVSVRIMMHAGDPCVRYEGGCVETETGERSEPVRQGRTQLPARFATRLSALIDSAGNRNPLRQKCVDQ